MAEMNLEYYSGSDQYSDGDVEERILEDVKKFRREYDHISGEMVPAKGREDMTKRAEEFETALADRLIADAYARENAEDAFAYLYHLSPVRQNILSWYPFRQGAGALEIGAGPGAITGLLCRRLASVTSADLSKRRCEINFERHRELDNLKIMVGNLNEMKFPGLFDYVILNGVFEYAASFTEGETPYQSFLRKCLDLLKEDGVLLVAIENRLGLKYFAGAPEDHTGNYMEGLKDYQAGSGVRTFSRAEWKDLAEDCGAYVSRIYYPYPDYKFPAEVFTDESLSADSYDRNSWNFNGRRLKLFEEGSVAKALQKEGALGAFMNSLLLEIRKKPCEEPSYSEHGEGDVIYAKMNADRDSRFRIQTLIRREKDGRKKVIKEPLTEEAKKHLERMHAFEKEAGTGSLILDGESCSVAMLPGQMEEEGMVYPWLSCRNLGEAAAVAADQKDARRMRELTKALWNLLAGEQPAEAENAADGKSTPADGGTAEYISAAGSESVVAGESVVQDSFETVFGPEKVKDPGPVVCPANIDLIFDNLFLDRGKAWIIDGEWIFGFPVPARFILWRTINELYSNHKDLEKVLPEADLLLEYGIDAADAQVFWTWADHFEKKYVKANGLGRYAKPVREADLKDIHTFSGKVRMTATLYLDRGQGFSEKDAVRREVSCGEDGHFQAEFLIAEPETVKALRFDPLEGSPCLCALSSGEGSLKPLNAARAGKKTKEGRVCEFLTGDPSYRLLVRGKMPARISVAGKVKLQSQDWALERAQHLLHRYQRIFRI